VIVDFWATWCPPCRKEIPELNEIYRRYQTDGLIVLGVSMDEVQGEGRKVVEPFIEEFKIAYPIAMGDEALVDKLELNSVPTALFVARDGRLFSRIEGAGPPGELTRATADLLKR
jgi:thiol-disulfide isomerase/thioredoxin